MPTRIPSEVRTRRREEMVCPNCFHNGLEAHPGFDDDYTGDANILRATRCPNDECHYHYGEGLPAQVVDQQFIRTSKLSALTGGFDVTTLLVGLLVIGGLIFLATQVFGIGSIPGLGGPTVDVTVGGQVLAADGGPVSNARVSAVGADVNATTDGSGTYQLANLTAGSYLVSIDPRDESLAASAVRLTVGTDGTVKATASNTASLTGTTLDIRLNKPVTVSAEGAVSNGSFLLNFSNPANAGYGNGVVVRLAPPSGETVTDRRTIPSGTPTAIEIPGTVTSQSVQVDAGVTTTQLQEPYRRVDSGSSVSLIGNLPPSDLSVTVAEQANMRPQVEETDVTGEVTMTADVRGEMMGELTVTVWGGSQTHEETLTGTYKGTNPRVPLDEESAPAQVDVSVTGTQTTERKSTRGSVSNDKATFTVLGTLGAENGVIEFNGGVASSDELAEKGVSADAQNGADTSTTTLFTAPADGSYRLDYDFSASRNENLVEAGYKVNGGLTQVDLGTGAVTLDLSAGDTVALWLKASQASNTQEKQFERGNHDIHIIDTSVSKTQVSPGESLSVEAIAENRGDSQFGTDAILFTDGTEADREYVAPLGGSTASVTFPRVTFSEPGTHTVSVNEGEQITVQVGSGGPASGAASFSASATRLGDDGTVKVDTNGDGSLDCTTDANGGRCTLGALSLGQHSLSVAQKGVSQTSYTVSYDSRFGARDVSVDIDNDGTPEIDQSGVLSEGETLTGSAQLLAGDNELAFEVGNGGDVEYEITYTEAAEVENPTVTLDGTTVLDEDTTTRASVDVGTLPAGEHEFRFTSSNTSQTFNARLEWTERSPEYYPDLTLDGETICPGDEFAGDRTCTVPSAGDPGAPLVLSFDGTTQPFDYDVAYTARAVPEDVTLHINGNERTIAPVGTPTDEWAQEASLSGLKTGVNSLEVETATVDGTLSTDAEATLTYTYTARTPTAPTVVVVNSDGARFETSVPTGVLGSNGILQDQTALELPAEWFTRGENEIRVSAANGGVLVTNVTATTGVDETLQIAPASESG